MLSEVSGICVSITFKSLAHRWGIISVLTFGLEILGTWTTEKDKNKQISDILVFYCCLINYHKHSSLKQYRFIILQFYRSKVQHRSYCTKVKVLARAVFLSGSSRGEFIS